MSRPFYNRICLSFISLTLLGFSFTPALAAEAPLYQDAQAPVEMRVADLLGRMTLEEKVEQIAESMGSRSNTRLGIPKLNKAECLHGYYDGTGPTVFPHSIALASMWNPDLMYQIAQIIGDETVAAKCQQAWSPVLDVARDPRWGRIEETYGEDPYLIGQMAVAWLKGFQSKGLIATPKHFAGHGAIIGGRDSNESEPSMRQLREVHLPAFRAAFLEARPKSTMCAYSTWDGTPCAASTDLLIGILREEWGFDGFIVSDCGAIGQIYYKHHVTDNYLDSVVLATEAGICLNCGDAYEKELVNAVRAGRVSEARLNELVGQMLRVKFEMGYFENPPPQDVLREGVTLWDNPGHKALALEAARQSTVMVKNEGVLPLKKTIKSIAMVGPAADTVEYGWYSAKPKEGQAISILKGIKKLAGPDTQVHFARGCDFVDPNTNGFAEAVAAAKKADVVIVAVGDKTYITTGENHDKAELKLPGAQDDLLKAIYDTGTPMVVVLASGRPYVFGWAAEKIPAFLVTWFGGEQTGNAVAEIVFGEYNPAGRLPMTFPRSTAQVPVFYSYKPSGRGYDYIDIPFAPQWRFGWGMSFTTFAYSNLQIHNLLEEKGLVEVCVDIQNTGDRAGDEVTQLYITDMTSSIATPVMQLKGFKRIHLTPKQKETVTMEIPAYDLSLLDRSMDRVLEPGLFKIWVGGSSPVAAPKDKCKENIAFPNGDPGVSSDLMIKNEYRAHFTYTLTCPPQATKDQPFNAQIQVANTGRMTDVGEVSLYLAGKPVGKKRFELTPGQTKNLELTVTAAQTGPQNISLVSKTALIHRSITIQ